MEAWEFLLQKKGDKSWLPLEAPTVEILEGQYRLASRSSFASKLIGIQLRYIPHPETSYRSTQQKISKRVNPEGLLIVMPYTHFTPGVWQISCQLDGKSEATKAWSTKLQFDVLPISPELSLDWQIPDLPEDVEDEITSLEETTLELDNDQSSSPSLNHEVTTQKHDFTDIWDEEIPIESDEEDFNPDEFSQAEAEFRQPSLADLPRYVLQLNSAQYLIEKGELLTITGTAYLKGEIEVTLKNPQNLQIIAQKRQSLELNDTLTVPIEFSCEMQLPPKLRSQVAIGEVRLIPQGIEALDLELQERIYQQVITVTYQSGNLLAEIEQQISESNATASVADAPTSVEPTVIKQKSAELSSETVSLPPINSKNAQPHPPAPARDKSRPVTLPPLPQLPLSAQAKPSNSPTPTVPASPANNNSPVLPPKLPPLPTLKPLNSEPNDALREPEIVPNLSMFEELVSSDLAIEENTELEPGSLEPLEELNLATTSSDLQEPELRYDFEDDVSYDFLEHNNLAATPPGEIAPTERPTPVLEPLQLGDRFLQKLQTLSLDNQSPVSETETADEATEAAPPAQAPKIELEALALELEQMLAQDESLQQIENLWQESELDTDLDSNYFLDNLSSDTVTEDYELAAVEAPPQESEPLETLDVVNDDVVIPPTAQPVTAEPPALPIQEPIPLPVLEVEEGELMAGTPVSTLVKLPATTSKLAVKLWVKDCQTRALVDGPRWLMDFYTSKDGEFVQTTTQITVPLTSMEVAFEAIAVEMPTQRESHKARITRNVTPPNLSQPIEIDFDDPWTS